MLHRLQATDAAIVEPHLGHGNPKSGVEGMGRLHLIELSILRYLSRLSANIGTATYHMDPFITHHVRSCSQGDGLVCLFAVFLKSQRLLLLPCFTN